MNWTRLVLSLVALYALLAGAVSAQGSFSGRWQATSGSHVWEIVHTGAGVSLRVVVSGVEVSATQWVFHGAPQRRDFGGVGNSPSETIALDEGDSIRFTGSVQLPSGQVVPFIEEWKIDAERGVLVVTRNIRTMDTTIRNEQTYRRVSVQ